MPPKRIFSLLCGLAAGLALAIPAQARWRVAESDRFIVYADDSARDLQRFAEQLERYHAGLERATGNRIATPSPSNRLTIFAVGNQRDVQQLMGGEDSNVAGFYIPRASGPMAFIQDVRPSSGEIDFSMTVLLHEYAHHFFISTSDYAMPRWMSEGGAEFFASARFPNSGALEIGRPALHRATELFYADEVPIRQLLDYDRSAPSSGRYSAFYGRSWLLYHYLSLDSGREGQINAYWNAVRSGIPPLEAAESVFGDLDRLEDDLEAYLDQRQMYYYTIQPSSLTVGEVRVRELSDGMNEVLPLMIRSRRGVDREQALELLPEIRQVAIGHPTDAGVLAALAEAEFDAGNDAEAIAAADRAIAIDPTLANPYVQKGYALFRQAQGSLSATNYTAAMAPFRALNLIENDHPLPLIYFYRSFVERGAEPTDLARRALERASQLAPFDIELKFNVVTMLAQEGQIELARFQLRPLLANPHDGSIVEQAQALDALLALSEEGTPIRMVALPREKPDEAGQAEGEGNGEETGESPD